MKKNNWLIYALITMVTWGVWGALSEIPAKEGFPSTLTYVVWSITMIICALIALKNIHFKLDTRKKSIMLGMTTGLLGAGGQLLLFQALLDGPAYIIFPITSLSPIVTVVLSMLFLKEKAKPLSIIGIILALVAIFCISYSNATGGAGNGFLWLIFAIIIFIAWGVQGFIMKVANNNSPDAESIFVYMAISAVLLVPVALFMTDFSLDINLGFKGPYLSFIIQILNAIGALFLVYAMRYRKAMVVSPLTNALAPVLTVILSLILYKVFPPTIQIMGIIAALIAVFILSSEPDETPVIKK